jgi:hypothetical protein
VSDPPIFCGLLGAAGVHLDTVVDERSDRNRDAICNSAHTELVAFRAAADCAQSSRVALKDKSQSISPRAVMDVVSEGRAETSKEVQAGIEPYRTCLVEINWRQPDHRPAIVYNGSGSVQGNSRCVVEVGIRNDGRAKRSQAERQTDQTRHNLKNPCSTVSARRKALSHLPEPAPNFRENGKPNLIPASCLSRAWSFFAGQYADVSRKLAPYFQVERLPNSIQGDGRWL